jgi:hypothetical protein
MACGNCIVHTLDGARRIMDDRQPQPARDNAHDRSAPAAPGQGERSPNGKPDRHGSEPVIEHRRSSTGKPALTERERRERWPLG